MSADEHVSDSRPRRGRRSKRQGVADHIWARVEAGLLKPGVCLNRRDYLWIASDDTIGRTFAALVGTGALVRGRHGGFRLARAPRRARFLLPDRPKPVVARFKAAVCAAIEAGDLLPGDKVLTDGELAQSQGIAKSTAARGCHELVAEGKLEWTARSFIVPWSGGLPVEVHRTLERVRALLERGETLPTTPELAKRLRVRRATLTAALQELAFRGEVERGPRGSYRGRRPAPAAVHASRTPSAGIADVVSALHATSAEAEQALAPLADAIARLDSAQSGIAAAALGSVRPEAEEIVALLTHARGETEHLAELVREVIARTAQFAERFL